MQRYREYIERKRREYKDKFDSSNLNQSFVPYFENGKRVQVDFLLKGKIIDTKRGTIGVTTGWKPSFLLMLTRRSISSPYTIGLNDKVVKIVD